MKKLLVVLLTLITSVAFAQSEHDFGARVHIDFKKAIKKAYISAHTEYRAKSNLNECESWFVTVGGGVKPLKWLNVGFNYEYWGSKDTHKFVPILTETLKVSDLSISLREKYEYSLSPAKSTRTNILRVKLQGAYQIPNSMFAPYVAYEYFTSFDTGQWTQTYHFAGTLIKFKDRFSFDVYYLYLLINSDVMKGRHILGLGFNMSF